MQAIPPSPVTPASHTHSVFLCCSLLRQRKLPAFGESCCNARLMGTGTPRLARCLVEAPACGLRRLCGPLEPLVSALGQAESHRGEDLHERASTPPHQQDPGQQCKAAMTGPRHRNASPSSHLISSHLHARPPTRLPALTPASPFQKQPPPASCQLTAIMIACATTATTWASSNALCRK